MENQNFYKNMTIRFSVLFGLLFLIFWVLRIPIFTNYNEIFGNYLTLYHSVRNIISLQEFPMWAPHLFLGGSFFGIFNGSQAFSPFFLLSLMLPTGLLMPIFLPLLFLKTIFAGLALALYLRETKWLSPRGIGLAVAAYLFSGWYFSYMAHFSLIELLIYLPYVLFGIESLFNRQKKRWLILGLSLVLTTSLPVAVSLLPIWLSYWLIRFMGLRHRESFEAPRQLKLFIITLMTTAGLNMVFLLPVLLSQPLFQFWDVNTINLSSFLTALSHTILPTLRIQNEGFSPHSPSSLFQTILLVPLIPQFLFLAPKRFRKPVVFSYLTLFLGVVVLQAAGFSGVFGLALTLFNSILIGFVFGEGRRLDPYRLKVATGIGSLLLLCFTGILFYRHRIAGLECGVQLAGYLFSGLVPLVFLAAYYLLLHVLNEDNRELLRKGIYTLFIIERLIFITIFMGTRANVSVTINQIVSEQDYIGNRIEAITSAQQAGTRDFHRVINSFQVHPNEPFMIGYYGFSSNSWQQANRMGEWMLRPFFEGASISIEDPFLTTALGARYFLTLDSNAQLPGYEFNDRVLGITIYRNQFFGTIGMRPSRYVLASEFEALSSEGKRYVFLQAVVLEDGQQELAASSGMVPFDLSRLPSVFGDIQYLAAAREREQMGISGIVFEDNSFSHVISTDAPQLLVYFIPYERGWAAYLNDKRIPLHPLNQGFMGIEVPEGDHQSVVLRFRTPGLTTSAVISISMLLFVIGYFYKKQEEGRSGKR